MSHTTTWDDAVLCRVLGSWRRHQMETFSVLVTGRLCGEFTGHRWISRTKPVTQSFDVFFDRRPNKRLSTQSWGWRFETPSRPLWRHCNVTGWLSPVPCQTIWIYQSLNKMDYTRFCSWYTLEHIVYYGIDSGWQMIQQDTIHTTWWRHQMEIFSALLAICAGNSPVPGEFPTQRPVTRSFDVYFDLCPNKRLSTQSWGWWFETQSRPLWRHRNVDTCFKWLPSHQSWVASPGSLSRLIQSSANYWYVHHYITVTSHECQDKDNYLPNMRHHRHALSLAGQQTR